MVADLPAAPPGTATQATADIAGLQDTATKGTLLASLANTVSADLLNLSFDLDGSSGSASSDLAKYQADVTQIRTYCKHVGGSTPPSLTAGRRRWCSTEKPVELRPAPPGARDHGQHRHDAGAGPATSQDRVSAPRASRSTSIAITAASPAFGAWMVIATVAALSRPRRIR